MRVSSDTAATGPFTRPDVADRHGGVADLDGRAVVEGGLGDLVAVDEQPVGGAEVDDAGLRSRGVAGVDADLRVPTRDAGVVDAQVGVVAAADDDAGRVEGVLHPVDLEDHAGPAYG